MARCGLLPAACESRIPRRWSGLDPGRSLAGDQRPQRGWAAMVRERSRRFHRAAFRSRPRSGHDSLRGTVDDLAPGIELLGHRCRESRRKTDRLRLACREHAIEAGADPAAMKADPAAMKADPA